MDAFIVGLIYGIMGFFKNFTGYSLVALILLTGIHLNWYLSKRGIGKGKGRWIALFCAEGISILWAVVASKWGVPWTSHGSGPLLLPRAATFIYAVEMMETFCMWHYSRKNGNRQPRKPPKREFCGDIT